MLFAYEDGISKFIKKGINSLPYKKVLEICIRIAKYKKENKELLNYLLFDADDEATYIKNIKEEIEEQFENLNKSNSYLAKKTIRKALRTANKYIKYSGSKKTQVEVLLFYCKTLKNSGIRLSSYTTIGNIYKRQIDNISKSLTMLHEDLQYDYGKELKSLIS